MWIYGLLEVTKFVVITSKLLFEVHDGSFDRVLFLLALFANIAPYAPQQSQQMFL